MYQTRRGNLPFFYVLTQSDSSRKVIGSQNERQEVIDPRFRQSASRGLTLPNVPNRVPITVEGMHLEKPEIRFRLPPAPMIEMHVENKWEEVEPRLHSIVVGPRRRSSTSSTGRR